MVALRLSERLGDQFRQHRYHLRALLVVEHVPNRCRAVGYRRFEKAQLLHGSAPAVSAAAGHPQPEVDAAEHPQQSGPGATVRRTPAMPAELVLPALCGRSGRSRSLGSASAYHQVVPKSDAAYRPGEPSPAHPAPAPRRHGAYERWLLARDIQRGGGGQSVEWFFDNISHEWLIRFLEHRIGDERILRLIRKWLKAGILEDGVVTVADSGTGQGSVISPLLANIYLHYVFDLWAERWQQHEAQGDMIVVRYADDLVAGFEHERDARRFLDAMRERFEAFSLSLHPDKTRLIEFGRHAAVDRSKRGVGKPETFAFLGFTFICGKSRRGAFQLQRKTRRDRMRVKLQEIKAELRQRMHQTIPSQGRWLEQVVSGHFAYYAVPTNSRALSAFRHYVA